MTKTVEEAITSVLSRLDNALPSDVVIASLIELRKESSVLTLAIALADRDIGPTEKILQAVSLGILIGQEVER